MYPDEGRLQIIFRRNSSNIIYKFCQKILYKVDQNRKSFFAGFVEVNFEGINFISNLLFVIRSDFLTSVYWIEIF